MQQQLASLIEGLNTTEPHYIRCVKPNNLLKPSIFENQNSLQQLRCGVRFTYIFGLPVHIFLLLFCATLKFCITYF